jgi:hypothetical protein
VIRPFAIVGALTLAACVKEPAPTSLTAPVLPCECLTDCRPAPAEPKVAADMPEGVSDLAAARDRQALKDAFRAERHNRATCTARLTVLFPKKEAKP